MPSFAARASRAQPNLVLEAPELHGHAGALGDGFGVLCQDGLGLGGVLHGEKAGDKARLACLEVDADVDGVEVGPAIDGRESGFGLGFNQSVDGEGPGIREESVMHRFGSDTRGVRIVHATDVDDLFRGHEAVETEFVGAANGAVEGADLKLDVLHQCLEMRREFVGFGVDTFCNPFVVVLVACGGDIVNFQKF